MTDTELKELVASLAVSNKETARMFKESNEKYDRIVEETNRKWAETDRKFKELGLNLSGISNSNGEFAEDYFFNSLGKKMEFAGVHFDVIDNSYRRISKMPDGSRVEDQFDIVMTNKKSVAIIEVKYKAAKKDVETLVTRKVKKFRALFSEYKNFKIYLGLGSLSFNEHVLAEAKKYGVGLLKQVGETIEYKADWEVKAY